MAKSKDLKEFVSILKNMEEEKAMLREVHPDVVDDYVGKMKDGVKFPPIVIGVEKLTNKQYIVDGLHRLSAAKQAGLGSITYEMVDYPDMPSLLADMLKRNLSHGLKPTAGERNRRIKLLLSRGLTMESIGSMVGLSKMSVSRISRDMQGEHGAEVKKKKGSKPEPMKGQAFAKSILKILASLGSAEQKRLILSYYLPSGDKKEGEEHTKQLLTSLQECIAALTALESKINS